MKTSFGLWIVVALIALVHGLPTVSAQGVKLEFKYEKGETKRFKTTITSQPVYEYRGFRPRVIVTETYETSRVDSVFADGSADIENVTDSAWVTVNGERVSTHPEAFLVGIPILKKMSKLGVMTDIRAIKEVPDEGKARLESDKEDPENKFGFPDKVISIGEVWDHDQNISQNTPQFTQETLLKLKWRLLGFERMLGYYCCVIRISGEVTGTWSATEASGRFAGTARGTVHFALKEGHYVRWFVEFDGKGTITTPDREINFENHNGYKREVMK